eukprot:jgi/Ulvmu1/478/UM001_0486.1
MRLFVLPYVTVTTDCTCSMDSFTTLSQVLVEHPKELALAVIVFALLFRVVAGILSPRVPAVELDVPADAISSQGRYDSVKHDKPGALSCKNPATGAFLGSMPCASPEEIAEAIGRARTAHATWKQSSWKQRELLMLTFNRAMLDHAHILCKLAVQDSGKPMVDAAFGELMVTCEKALWLAKNGKAALQPETRQPGIMMFYKQCRVEHVPLGVVGTIVPWNYPFHNILNPLLAALFAGNGIVIKVSEHASWSSQVYQQFIDAVLRAVGAPPGLVTLVTGGVETGRALVRGGVQKVIFIGSTGVGRAVMRDAADTLTPVTLELGGKDPFVVCGDARVAEVVPTALRAAFQSCGQNCVAAERFIVHEAVYEEFLAACAAITSGLRQGDPLGPDTVDCGAMCLPGLAEQVHALVEDARARGARILAGGTLPDHPGQFYPPTIVADVTPDMRVWREETFGPLMTVAKCTSDDHAVELANDCDFGLGSACFAGSQARAVKVGQRIKAGMFVANDFSSNAMCQSLPFGGIKESGFDRFGGIEGLRGMCYPKVVVVDRLPAVLRTTIPPPLQYPVAGYGFEFVHGLCKMFFGSSIAMQLAGLVAVIKLTVMPPADKPKAA